MIPLQNICAEIFAHEIFQKGLLLQLKRFIFISQNFTMKLLTEDEVCLQLGVLRITKGRFPLRRIFHTQWYFLLSFDTRSPANGL